MTVALQERNQLIGIPSAPVACRSPGTNCTAGYQIGECQSAGIRLLRVKLGPSAMSGSMSRFRESGHG